MTSFPQILTPDFMSTVLNEMISVLCDETGIAVPEPDARGMHIIRIEEHELRVQPLKQGRFILLGVIGRAGGIAERREQSRQALLSTCLTLQAVRFGRLGTSEVLTLEPESDELVLWRSFEESRVSISAFLQAAESLINETEFWKNWLSNV